MDKERSTSGPYWKNQGFETRYEWIKSDPERYEKHKERARQTGRVARKWLYAYKLERGCMDCGFKTHFAALQMDHTGTKSAEISDLRNSLKKLQKEIEDGQCVVRCANCHAIKTWCDKNGIEYNPEDYREKP